MAALIFVCQIWEVRITFVDVGVVGVILSVCVFAGGILISCGIWRCDKCRWHLLLSFCMVRFGKFVWQAGRMQTGRMVGADGQDGRMVGTVREESCGTRSGSDELCLATGMRVFLYHVILQLELDVDVDVLT